MSSQSFERSVHKIVEHEAGDLDEVPHARLVYNPPHPARIGLPKNLRRGDCELFRKAVRSNLQQHSLPAVVFIAATVANSSAEKETQLLRRLCVEYSITRERRCFRQCPPSDCLSRGQGQTCCRKFFR